jgi:hypothetical protein
MHTLFGEIPDTIEEPTKKSDEKTLKIWDLLDDLKFNKKNLSSEEDFEKLYQPFMVNKGMSQLSATIMYANEMNMSYHLNKKMQHDFYFYMVPKLNRQKNRTGKWARPEKSQKLEMVKQYFGYNDTKAKKALAILDDEQLKMIKEEFIKGGTDYDE